MAIEELNEAEVPKQYTRAKNEISFIQLIQKWISSLDLILYIPLSILRSYKSGTWSYDQ